VDGCPRLICGSEEKRADRISGDPDCDGLKLASCNAGGGGDGMALNDESLDRGPIYATDFVRMGRSRFDRCGLGADQRDRWGKVVATLDGLGVFEDPRIGDGEVGVTEPGDFFEFGEFVRRFGGATGINAISGLGCLGLAGEEIGDGGRLVGLFLNCSFMCHPLLASCHFSRRCV
jgi:hypothetical protein